MYELETARLHLLPFTSEDESALHHLFIDPFIRKYLWDDEILTPEQSKEVLLQNITHFEKDHWGLWKIQKKGSRLVMGFVGLWYFFEEPQPQILYGLLEKFSGQGYASEAAKEIVTYAFEQLRFTYLLAAMDDGHEASEKVAKRIGMSFMEKKKDEQKETVFYKITKD